MTHPESTYEYWLENNSATQRREGRTPPIAHPPAPRYVGLLVKAGLAVWAFDLVFVFIPALFGGSEAWLMQLFGLGLILLLAGLLGFRRHQLIIDPKRYRRVTSEIAVGLAAVHVAHEVIERIER